MNKKTVFTVIISPLCVTILAPQPKRNLTGLTSIQHTYESEGTYTVMAEAMNAYSSATVSRTFAISGLDCAPPKVFVINYQALIFSF